MTVLPNLIGLTGRAQHGKNTVGDALVALGYRQVGFADALKSMALVLDPIVPAGRVTGEVVGCGDEYEHLSRVVNTHGWEAAKTLPEVRRLLQVLGTECVRDHIGADAWVQALARRIGTELAAGRRYVITDVRFPNEAAWINNLGGEVWRVVRPHFDNGLPEEHPSEAFVDTLPAFLQIANDDTLEHLQKKVRDYAVGRLS